MKKAKILFLIILSGVSLFAQTSLDIEERTMDAINQWFILDEAGFFSNNYERFFDKSQDNYSGRMFGFNVVDDFGSNYLWYGSNTGHSDRFRIGTHVFFKNVGSRFLRVSGDFQATLVDSGTFLHPVDSWVDSDYYLPSYIKYDVEAAAVLFDFISLGFSTNGYSEKHKDFLELEPLIMDLTESGFQKYSLNFLNFAKLFNGLNSNSLLFRLFKKSGLNNVLIVKDFKIPKLLNNVLFTGNQYFPLVSTVYLPELNELLIEGSAMLPLGFTAIFVDAGYSLFNNHLYKASVRFDIMEPIFRGFGSNEIANSFNDMRVDLLSGSLKEDGLFVQYGPELYYFDYPFLGDSIYPYRNDIYFSEGLQFRMYANLLVKGDGHMISFNMSIPLGAFIGLLDNPVYDYYFDSRSLNVFSFGYTRTY